MLSFLLKRMLPVLMLVTVAYVSQLKAQTVYKTPSGEKYHTASCRMVKNVSEAITPEQARELGLEACKICKPAAVYGSGSGSKQPQGQSQTVQCKGRTKAGTRCKHMTGIANGYCFQHQPQ